MFMDKNNYKTSDLDLASYLIAEKHCQLKGIERKDGKQYFILTPYPGQDTISDFVNNLTKVTPRQLLDARRVLVTALRTTGG